MKKSEQYFMAMAAVLEYPNMTTRTKLEVLETLMSDKSSAEWSEKREAEKNADVS